MNSIKQTAKTRPIVEKRRTIDAIHQEIVDTFEEHKSTLEKKRSRIKTLEKEILAKNEEIAKCRRHGSSSLDDSFPDLIVSLIDLQKRLGALKNEVADIEADKHLNMYILYTHDILADYFSGKNCLKKTEIRKKYIRAVVDSNVAIDPKLKSTLVSELYRDYHTRHAHRDNEFSSFIQKSGVEDGTEESLDDKNDCDNDNGCDDERDCDDDLCRGCKSLSTFVTYESFRVCTNCGLSLFEMNIQESPGYKEMENYEYRPYFRYKKSSHLNTHLAKLQAKEKVDIPQEVIQGVMKEISKHRLDPKKINQTKVREFLKKLGFTKYYSNSIYIINIINGKEPPTLSPQMEDRIRFMFDMVQPVFQKYKPDKRKNFISYPYTIYKLCQLLEYNEFLPYLRLLKNPEKLQAQENLWKVICKELKWEFIPIKKD
jgi:hypothetical protein